MIGSVLYSLGVGVKMNVLLFAPALLLLFMRNTGTVGTILNLSICAGIQLLVGAPFLATYPWSYLRKAFELSRVFFYKWTVNLRFLPESVFVSKPVALLLLFLHLAVLIALITLWVRRIVTSSSTKTNKGKLELSWGIANDISADARPKASSSWSLAWLVQPSAIASAPAFEALAKASDSNDGSMTQKPQAVGMGGNVANAKGAGDPLGLGQCYDSPLFIAALLYASNMIGVIFARTLHYQFYSWYISAVPLVMGAAGAPAYAIIVTFGLLELAFLTFPATATSSLALQLGHLIALGAIVSASAGTMSLPWSYSIPRTLLSSSVYASESAVGWFDSLLQGLGRGSGGNWEATNEAGWSVQVVHSNDDKNEGDEAAK